MARRYGRRRHRASRKLPILTIGALAVPVIEAVMDSGGSFVTGFNVWQSRYTGYDAVGRAFNPSLLLHGWGPLIAVKGLKMLHIAPKVRGLPVSFS